MFVQFAEKSIHVAIAGWNNPPSRRAHRAPEQTHLGFYSNYFHAVEINSSFYRPHKSATYLRWRDETPDLFRFSVKMPRSITHESHLRGCAGEVERFYDEIAYLQPKLATVLAQLPPDLQFNGPAARAFFSTLPRLQGTHVVCEPRHASWFTNAADEALRDLGVARVAADPVRCPGADVPAGATCFAYFRWHGSPHMYYSKYSQSKLLSFVHNVLSTSSSGVWCVFDNTANYAAWDDALLFASLLQQGPGGDATHYPLGSQD